MTTDISNERLAELIRGWQNVAAMDASARELVAALRELASRRALDEWMPIESVPRSARVLIGGGPMLCTNRYYDLQAAWVDSYGNVWADDRKLPGAHPAQPTHWRPLPPPPAQEKTDARD